MNFLVAVLLLANTALTAPVASTTLNTYTQNAAAQPPIDPWAWQALYGRRPQRVVYPSIVTYDMSYYPYAYQNIYVNRDNRAGPPWTEGNQPRVWNMEAALGYSDYLERVSQVTRPRGPPSSIQY